MSFDSEEFRRQIAGAAAEKTRGIAQEVKDEMAAEIAAIEIGIEDQGDTGDQVRAGGIKFPSPAIQDEFMRRFNQRLQDE